MSSGPRSRLSQAPRLPRALLAATLPISLLAAAACSDSTATSPSVANLVVVTGNNPQQTDTVTGTLATPLEVLATDANGTPIPNVTITWTPGSQGNQGVPSSSSVTTNTNGLAQVTWTLGTKAGTDSMTATANGATPIVFTATATPGAPAQVMTVNDNPQSATAGSTIPFSVEVLDQYGNPISGATVSWAVATGGGALNLSSSTTDANGQAQVSWTLGVTAGTNTITATVGTLTPTSFSVTGQ